MKIAQEEHDAFCHLLRQNGVEVVYLTDLVAESLADPAVKDQFLREYITEAGIWGEKRVGMMLDYFKTMSTKNMVEKMMEGVRKSEVRGYGKKNLTDYLDDYYPFVLDPIPNLYFTRDPFAAIGSGVSVHRMSTVTRSRETLFAKYIFRYNPHYKGVPVYYDRHANATVEGGDILVLSDKVVAIGISQRTQPWAIEQLAKELLSQRTGFEKVLAIDIPKTRVYASGYGVYHGRLRQIYYAPQHQRRPAPICSGAGPQRPSGYHRGARQSGKHPPGAPAPGPCHPH